MLGGALLHTAAETAVDLAHQGGNAIELIDVHADGGRLAGGPCDSLG